MALKFLLDTHGMSELTKPQPNAGVLQQLAHHEADCALAATSLEELAFGCHRLEPGARRDSLLRGLAGLPDQLPVLASRGADLARRCCPTSDDDDAKLTPTESIQGGSMGLRAADIVPISEAGACLAELAEDVVGNGAEKVLTKDGASYVALVDARLLDRYHTLEQEHARLVLANDAITGLQQALNGEWVSDAELDQALGIAAAP